MQWSRIDMEKREVLLDTKVVEVEIDGEKILKPIEKMKNSSSRAYDDYVCTDKPGNLLTPRYVTLRFSQVLEKNGMRHIRFHDLRHTFASILINKDIPIFNVSKCLGHSDISTTVQLQKLLAGYRRASKQ